MECDNLRTASIYINNQLLSRGLLRDGQTIDFARPEKGDGGVGGTMARVMGVVNDLILRRDRDASQREGLTQTIRSLRADSLRHTSELERINTRHSETQRKLGVADAAERALKLQLKSTEQAARGLREEMARMKILVAQTRAQCANEVRKRERVIDGLKKHVADGARPRGSGRAVGVVTINVVAGVGAEGGGGSGGKVVGTDDTGYDLRMETNEFLTELARGLSEENENLAGLVRRTTETLRTLSGCEKEHEKRRDGMMMVVDNAYETLAVEMEMVIEHLRNLLTNPSFVPIEEVEVREEEIIRLRQGWERMESRWKEAVQMMDGWRKRMARSGQTVNLEELKMGLMLSPLKPKDEDRTTAHQLSALMEEGEDSTQVDIDAMDDSGVVQQAEPNFDEDEDVDDSASSLFEDDRAEEVAEEVSEEEPVQERTFDTASSQSPGPPPQLSPLRETSNGNRGTSYPVDKQFTTIIEENTYDLLQLDTSSSHKQTPTPQSRLHPSYSNKNTNTHLSPPSSASLPPIKPTRPHPASPQKPTTASSHPNHTLPPKLQPSHPSSKLPRPSESHLPPQSPLTMASIAAKLAATEREADAARVRAKIKAARMGRASAVVPEPAMPPPPPPSIHRVENAAEQRVEGGAGCVVGDDAVCDDVQTWTGTGTETGPEMETETGTAISTGDDPRPVAAVAVDSSMEVRVRKRKASGRSQGGRASRRRSTLSPWELETLLTGQVV